MSAIPIPDAELLRRHDRPGPRYTSYPTAPQFRTTFGAAQLRQCVARSNTGAALRSEVATIERRYRIEFADYFSDALERLQPHLDDGLVRIEDGRIAVTPSGRPLLRSTAMCFEAYLNGPRSTDVTPFSRVV
jgi:coproporphyrinogen III oxidase-like Fe-S oxidoreductase